ncbi:MAG: gliding motility-associated C-terminal domain-containing protein, partial [Chitinophagaceae bacterium]
FSSFTNGNIRPTFSTEGLYNIQLVVNTVEGCKSDTVNKKYFIYNRPTAKFILPKNCVLDVSNFINTSSITSNSNIIFYKWDFGINSLFSDTSVLQNPSYQYNAANTYPVKLIVKTNQGCLDSITQNFTVNGAIPTAKLAFAINPVCSGDSVVLQNQSNVNFGSITKMEITWGTTLIVDNNPIANNSYTFKFLEFGNPATKTEPIKIKAFSGINCFSEEDTIVTLKAQPRVRFLLPVDSLCGNNLPISLNQGVETNGTVGTFAYEGNGVVKVGATYQFLPKNTNVNSKTIIIYEFTTLDGCFDTASQAVQIVDYPIVNAGLNKIVESGEKVLLQANAIGANLRYLWTPSALVNNPTSLQPIVSTNKDTVFLLTATNTFGCFDTSSVKVRVLPPVIPPNAFSPNGDGINDTWQIKSLSDYPRSEIFIFNRYGQQVYTSIGYKNPWDGTYNQHPVPVATYYYVINLKNGKTPIVGWVQLLR